MHVKSRASGALALHRDVRHLAETWCPDLCSLSAFAVWAPCFIDEPSSYFIKPDLSIYLSLPLGVRILRIDLGPQQT